MQTMKTIRLRALLAGVLFGLLATSSANALLIDAFDAGSLNFVPAASSLDVFTASTMVGGERDETLTNTGVGALVAGANGGTYSYGALNAPGSALIVWDGVDTNAAVDATGLGGVDFTDAGATDGFRIQFDSNDFVAPITLTVFTSATDFSSVTVNSPGGIPLGPPQALFITFTSFTPTGVGADFTNVGAFTMLIDGSAEPQLDMTLSFIETTTVPEPGTFATLALGLVGLGCFRRRTEA